jgi:hypothetical protein
MVVADPRGWHNRATVEGFEVTTISLAIPLLVVIVAIVAIVIGVVAFRRR